MPKVLAQNINPCNCRLVRLQVCNARNRGMCFLCFLRIIIVSNYWYLLLLLQIAILFSKKKLLFSVACCFYFIIVVIIICRFPKMGVPTFLDLQSHAQAAVIRAYNVLTQEIGSRYFDNNFCHEKWFKYSWPCQVAKERLWQLRSPPK